MKILLIGCGNLGKSLLKIWSESLEDKEIIVVQPSLYAQNIFKQDARITFVKDMTAVKKNFIAKEKMTLADIYNIENITHKSEKVKKIGF